MVSFAPSRHTSHLTLRLAAFRPAEYKTSRLPRNCQMINWAYGGVLFGGAMRERVGSFSFLVFHRPLRSSAEKENDESEREREGGAREKDQRFRRRKVGRRRTNELVTTEID